MAVSSIIKATKIKYHALSIQEILDNLEQANNRVNMLFLDACRDVPTGTKGGTKGLGQIATTPKGTLIVYATEAGRVAEDSTIFIEELTKGISTPNKKIWEIGNGLSNVVATKTNDKQVPEMFSKRLPARLTLNRVEESRRVDLSTNTTQGITQIGNLMYQNQPFSSEDKSNYDNNVEGGRVWRWQGAKDYCEGLTLGNYHDWRLPSRKELKKLLTTSKQKNSQGYGYYIDSKFLENMPPLSGEYKWATFWTSTIYEKDSSDAWGVFFSDGRDYWHRKSFKGYALCIRGQ